MNKQPYKWMNCKNNLIILSVKVVPNSSKNSILNEDEYLKVKLTAPAVDNKANKALIEFFAKKFNIPKTSIEILSGQTSKQKRISLPCTSEKSILSSINSN